ncbi:MAG: hypothetical protein DCC71_12960 [Proteobacteria bacterium]|nr:MAG: hypothetical protein DCC71_12960 [Pseudomonadota bacterium]
MATRALRRSALVLLAALALGCSSTRIVATWSDPESAPVQFRKVVGVALSGDTTLRRIAEDEFVRVVGPALAIAGYRVLPDEEMRDRERAQARVEAAGADGAVVYRLAGVETRERWVPPTTYGHAWGYWGWAAPMVYEPGYLTTDRYVQIETTVYDVASARLVWAARSETLNPDDAHDVIDEVVRASVDALREAGLLPPE